MKKLLVSLAVALFCTATASAQMFNLRVEAGPVFSFSSLVEHGTKVLSAGTKVGYHAGAFADISLTKGLYASTGLSFEMKGSRDHSYLDGKTLKVNKEALNEITMHYLQIPVNVGYRLSLTPSIRFAVQTGPYFAVALGGTQKTKSKITGAVKSFNIFKEGVFGLDKANRFDVGWGAFCYAISWQHLWHHRGGLWLPQCGSNRSVRNCRSDKGIVTEELYRSYRTWLLLLKHLACRENSL